MQREKSEGVFPVVEKTHLDRVMGMDQDELVDFFRRDNQEFYDGTVAQLGESAGKASLLVLRAPLMIYRCLALAVKDAVPLITQERQSSSVDGEDSDLTRWLQEGLDKENPVVAAIITSSLDTAASEVEKQYGSMTDVAGEVQDVKRALVKAIGVGSYCVYESFKAAYLKSMDGAGSRV